MRVELAKIKLLKGFISLTNYHTGGVHGYRISNGQCECCLECCSGSRREAHTLYQLFAGHLLVEDQEEMLVIEAIAAANEDGYMMISLPGSRRRG